MASAPRRATGPAADAVTPDAPGNHPAPAAVGGSNARQRLIATAEKDCGIKEATGHNDGPRINTFQRLAGIKVGTATAPGDPYCIAALFTWHLETFGEANIFPRTGWTPDAIRGGSADVSKMQPGDVFSIYFPKLGRDAHGGLFTKWRGPLHNVAETIEANTDPTGGRDGDGVYRRTRAASALHKFKSHIP